MDHESVPAWLARWGAIAWRLIGIGVVVYFGFQALNVVGVVILAAVVALFLTAVLWSPAHWLKARGIPSALSSLVTLLLAVAVVAGVFYFIAPQVAGSFDSLSRDVTHLVDSGRDWLTTGPLDLTQAEIDSYWEDFTDWARSVGGQRLLGGATVAFEVLTGALLALIVTFFLLKDGRGFLDRLTGRLSNGRGEKVRTGFEVGRKTLASYMRGVALVGLFDAILIAIALWLVGTPLVFPLAVIVFFGAFIPLVGAFVSGLLAVAVSLVNGGLVDGLIVLGAIVTVQQIEGHVILPLVYGRTLSLHPMVILLGVTAGGVAFGLFGAFLAVPTIAVVVAIHDAISEDPESSLLSLTRG